MRRFLPILALLLALAACQAPPMPPTTAMPTPYASVLIEGVPHLEQKPDFCGEACAAMALQALGKKVDQDFVFDQSGVDPLEGRGAWTRELKVALEALGFEVGPVWNEVEADRADEGLDAQFAALHADLVAGIPSIICTHYDDRPNTTEHFRLILGYDAAADEVLYHEPAEADGAYLRMARARFLKLWPLQAGGDTLSVIRFRLKPGKLAATRVDAALTPADYAQHVLALKEKMPEGFTMVYEPPFLVVGDDDPATVRKRSAGTVRWATRLLKQDYFGRDPDKITDIWLFADEASYTHHTRELFGEAPDTPYGFYSPYQNALVMNISTGGGTLVHEMVHPFIHANFPECPSWFNEGLASLYEQCGEEDGHIHGYTNWRLAGLQKLIKAGRLPSFKELLSTSEEQFYDGDRGDNYAQARYLCYYLQQKGLLIDFYRAFVANQRTDPSGYDTLVKLLGDPDMEVFQKEWEAWALTLRFP